MLKEVALTIALLSAASSGEAATEVSTGSVSRAETLYLFEDSTGAAALTNDPNGANLMSDLPQRGWIRALDRNRKPIAPVTFVEDGNPNAGILGFAPTPAKDILHSVRERGYFFAQARPPV